MDLNQQQVLSGTRTVLTVAGTIAAAVGVLQPAAVPEFINAVLAVVGPGVVLYNFVYGIWVHNHDNAIKHAVAAIQAKPVLSTVMPLAGALRDAGAVVNTTAIPVLQPSKEV